MKISIHLGLGDTIICAPIIAKLASENEEVLIPCWQHNIEIVKSFFVKYPNVKIVPYINHNDYMGDFADAKLKLGVYNKDNHQSQDESFVQWFFRQAGMSEEERWKWCPIANNGWLNTFKNNKADPFIFVHDDYKRGFSIKEIDFDGIISRPSQELTILNYVHALMWAKEIHCIDSAFIHLAESVLTTGKLFYHQYARPNSTDNYKFRKEWTILKGI